MSTPRGRCVGLAIAIALFVGSCAEVAVQTAVDEREANEIISLLLRAGVAADKVPSPSGKGRFAVEVSSADAARAFDLLREAGLPRPPSSGFAELYSGDRLIPTAAEERARLRAALTGELARSVETIDGVLEARVHLSMPERDPLEGDGEGVEPPRASVLIRYGTLAPPYDEASVKRLIAGGVPGLADERVAIIGVRRTPRVAAAGGARVASSFPVVLGIRVDPSSAGTLKAMLGGFLLVIFTLSAALVVGVLRRRKREEGASPRGSDRR